MLIRNADVLAGPDLCLVSGADMRVEGGRFVQVGPGLAPVPGEETLDCTGLLAVPGFVNAHTHIGDSVGKDIALDGSVDETIHPVFGAKSKILKKTPAGTLANFMANTCHSMIRKGVTTFADFREGGPAGAALLREVLKDVPIRAVVLGRVEFYQGVKEIQKNAGFPAQKEPELEDLLGVCDGVGVSGANENSTAVLERYSDTPKLRAIHSAETEQSAARSQEVAGRSETSRALALRPDFLVHMTYAPADDLRMAAKATRGIVVCPRANSALAEGIPDIAAMQMHGCTLALGTDNVMVNSPDMFREMDFAWKAGMGICKKRIPPRDILKMATVNGGKILNMDVGRRRRF